MSDTRIRVSVDIRLRATLSRVLPDWLVEELGAAGIDMTDADAIGDELEKRLRKYGDYDPDSIGFPFEYYEGDIETDDIEIDDVTLLPPEAEVRP